MNKYFLWQLLVLNLWSGIFRASKDIDEKQKRKKKKQRKSEGSQRSREVFGLEHQVMVLGELSLRFLLVFSPSAVGTL